MFLGYGEESSISKKAPESHGNASGHHSGAYDAAGGNGQECRAPGEESDLHGKRRGFAAGDRVRGGEIGGYCRV